jgi:hypothetical protein
MSFSSDTPTAVHRFEDHLSIDDRAVVLFLNRQPDAAMELPMPETTRESEATYQPASEHVAKVSKLEGDEVTPQ